MSMAVKDDLCSGCRVCEVLCGLTHFKEINPKKAAIRVEALFPEPGKFHVVFCDQCGKCAEACPEGAIRNQDGVYLIDRTACINCGICMQECPRNAIFSLPSLPSPIKCDMCGECVEWCPRGAIHLKGGN